MCFPIPGRVNRNPGWLWEVSLIWLHMKTLYWGINVIYCYYAQNNFHIYENANVIKAINFWELLGVSSQKKKGYFAPGGWGALQYQMDMGVRLTLPKAGAFGENTISKNEGSLGEKPNCGSKLGGIGWKCYFWSFSEHFKSRNFEEKKLLKMAKMINLLMKLKQKVASCGGRM